MPVTISSVLHDDPPTTSILDFARPITDLPGVTSTNWVNECGVTLLYRCQCVHQVPRRESCTVCERLDDKGNPKPITPPEWWPELVEIPELDMVVDPTYCQTDGKAKGMTFREGTALGQSDKSVGCDFENTQESAIKALDAHLSAAIVCELWTGGTTLNVGLQTIASGNVIGDGVTAVSPAVAISNLIEAATQSPEPGAKRTTSGLMISAPAHAEPLLKGCIRYVDGVPHVGHLPFMAIGGESNESPYADPFDYTTAAPAEPGTAWFYIHPRPYVGIDDRVSLKPAQGIEANKEDWIAERKFIVAFKPCPVFAVLADINEKVC